VEDVLNTIWLHLDSHTAKENARFWISQNPSLIVAKSQHAHTSRGIKLMCTNKCRKTTSSTMVQSLLAFARRVCNRMNFLSSCSNMTLQYIQPGYNRPDNRHVALQISWSFRGSPVQPVTTVLFEEARSQIPGTLITVSLKLFEAHSVAEQPAHNLGTKNCHVKNWVSFYSKCNQIPRNFFVLLRKVAGTWRWMCETIFMRVHTKIVKGSRYSVKRYRKGIISKRQTIKIIYLF
jgi:hypothetical protein